MLGDNPTGLVTDNMVVGGENPTLKQAAIPGQDAIFFGSGATAGSTAWPKATVAAFKSHIGQVLITGTEAKPTQTPVP